MIGRFLLGAGLGGLVGVGLLVLASLLTPLRTPGLEQPTSAQTAERTPDDQAAVPAAPAPVAPEPDAAATAPEQAAADPAADGATSPAAGAPAATDPSAEATATAPQPSAPEAATESAAPRAGTAQTAETPQAGTAETGETAPSGATAEVADGESAGPVAQAPAASSPLPAVSEPAPAAEASAPGAQQAADAAEPSQGPAEAAPEPAPSGPSPAAVTEAPAAPAPLPDAESQPAQREAAAEPAPASPEVPQGPAVPAAEALPATPETPSQAPDLAAVEAPAPPAAPDAPAEAPALSPQTGEGGAVPAPAAMPAPLAEGAPAMPDLPAPPPLTPEEEAILAEAAPPGDADAMIPQPDDGAAEAAPDADAAESTLPAVLPLPGEGTLQGETEGRVALGEGAGSTLPSTPSLIDRDGTEDSRLPRIGEAEAPSPAGEAEAVDAPRVAFARPFDNPAGKPVLALILIDTGEDDLDRAALAALPFPVTIALDPMAPGAADRAAAYRAAGQEVVMLTTALPEGAAASDVEQAFQVMAQNLPQAVAVMDLPERSFQGDRKLAGAVVPLVGAQGRGIVTWDEGLNAADQVARREDVPAAVVFRALDAEGEATPVIRRYLDRAAFKAAQEGRVAVVGHTRPETIAALLEWAVEGRAATVALAPVTAVLSVD